MNQPPQIQRPQPSNRKWIYITLGLLLIGGLCTIGLCSFSQGGTSFLSILWGFLSFNNGRQGACIAGMLAAMATPAIIGLAVTFFMIAARKTPHKALKQTEQYIQSQEEHLATQAAQAVLYAPDATGVYSDGVLGAAIQGTLAWCNGPWCLLPEHELSQHGVLIGASGSGKTITLLRIAYLAAKLYGYKVFFIDAKPSRQTAARFITLMKQTGIQTTMFPREAYNGWNGDGNAILNRLMAIEIFTEPYYKATAKRILNAICKPNPPVNSIDFLRKLDTLNIATIPGITARDLGGVQNRYHAFFDSLDGQLDGSWTFDNIDAGYLLLDGTALKEEAAALGRYLIEDFGHYCTTRKPEQHKTLLIIDEYSALSQSGADTANLFERIRESGGAILVAGQGYASMGKDIERMLDAANFYIVHRSAAPEQITKRAGTIKEIAESYAFGGNLKALQNEKGNIKLEEQLAIDPNKARKLATGESIIISHGHYMMTHIAPAPTADNDQITQARAWIDEKPAQEILPEQPTPPAFNPHPPELL